MKISPRPLATFPFQGIIYDKSGRSIDGSSWVWRLNDITGRTRIDWKSLGIESPAILSIAVSYLRDLIEGSSTDSVRNAFGSLKMVVRQPEIAEAVALNQPIPLGLFVRLREELGNRSYRLHYARDWYGWAADHGYPNFCPDIAFEIARLRIGGNAKGHAVLSADPEQGPLDDLEVSGLRNALRSAAKSRVLTKAEEAAVWICLALGPNPIQPSLMREEDVKVIPDADGMPAFVHVEVPRMKKGDTERRESFRRRPLTWEIGRTLVELIEENRTQWVLNPELSKFARPLFARKNPSRLLGGPMDEYALHLSPSEFTTLVARAVNKLGVVSHRTGLPLVVTTRRLRYTYATNLVREGVSKREIADLLDHTDLQNVQVYFDVKSDIVAPLDKAMAVALGPIAQAFMGKLVTEETEADRGNDPRSRIAVVDPEADTIRPVGTCGSYGFCGLMAPVACYTCSSFQPWADAPHHVLLEKLIADRERRVAAGRDGRMVSIFDDTILAIGDVIARIEARAHA